MLQTGGDRRKGYPKSAVLLGEGLQRTDNGPLGELGFVRVQPALCLDDLDQPATPNLQTFQPPACYFFIGLGPSDRGPLAEFCD